MQPEITPKNFMNEVLIPIPKNEVEEKIIKEVEEKIRIAKLSRRQYKKNMERAKKLFMKMVIHREMGITSP